MKNATKISIRFFNDKEVRAIWDEENSKWWFSVLDVVGVLNTQDDYEKNRNYWKYLKAKLKKTLPELVSDTTQLKLTAADGKKYKSDVMDYNQVIELAKNFPNNKSAPFIQWFTYSDETVDAKSKTKAYALFESSLLDSIEVGTVNGLKQIHGYLFGGLYDLGFNTNPKNGEVKTLSEACLDSTYFAGKIRTVNISKGGFKFAAAEFLPETLDQIEKMSEDSFDQIIDKYVEMNVAHPFREGNGRTTRIWLDLILKRSLKKCVDWSQINKKDYLEAMEQSVMDSTKIKQLIQNALTDKINDREMFMKGIDYSYYYEEAE